MEAASLTFDIDPADIDETPRPDEQPSAYVERLARSKAEAVAARRPTATIIGADTIVAVDGRLLGKPDDAAHAAEMLAMLSGRDHQVLTGVAVSQDGRTVGSVDVTTVWFKVLDAATIGRYVAGGEPLDKAGAYGIQGEGRALVARIEGAFDNVVGLPMTLLSALLTRTLGETLSD